MLTLLACDWLLTLALAPFFGLLALFTASALFRRPTARVTGPRPIEADAPPRFLVVIPAHNEEDDIAGTVRSCLALEYDPSRFRVCVVADNCDDATARVAREAGASVVERHDDLRRSKGYALEDFFEQHAGKGPDGGPDFDAAVVIDADTVADADLLARFADGLAAGDDWVQAYYTVRNPDASWRTRLLTYAFSLFNGVWLLGQDRLGLSVGFRGNGMCFSARGLARVPWRAYGLVEDQEFSWTLRVAGERVRFLAGSRVYGEMVSRGRAAVSQRRRWEDGRRSLRHKFLRAVIASPRMSVADKALSVVELVFPPLTSLAGLLFLAAAVPLVALAWQSDPASTAARSLLALQGVMALTFLAYALSPPFTLGLPWRYLASLSALPYYAAWKLAATVRSRTTSWVRTQRESAASPAVDDRDA